METLYPYQIVKLNQNHNERITTPPVDAINYDYFHQKLHHCWLYILKFINEPRDVESLIATSAYFSELLQSTTKKLEKLVLPILLKNGCWTSELSLVCRTISKKLKTVADQCIYDLDPSWIADPFICSGLEGINRLIATFPSISKEVSSVSFLRDHLLVLQDLNEECFDGILALFQKFGPHVANIRLEMCFEEELVPLFLRLIQILNLLPNLRKLRLDFRRLFKEIRHAHRVDGNRGILEMEAGALPPLKELTFLELLTRNRGLNPRRSRFIQLLFEAYGAQLQSLSWEATDFQEGICLEDSNSWLSDLRTFYMSQWHTNADNLQFRKLIRVQWPLLTRIELDGIIQVGFDFLLALCKYRRTLESLVIDATLTWDGFEVEDLLFVDLDLGIFPKLTKLTMCTSEADSEIWQLFRIQFVNLKQLRFLPENVKEKGSWRVVRHPLPDAAMRSKFFQMFALIPEFEWVDVDERNQRRFEVVFRRPTRLPLAELEILPSN